MRAYEVSASFTLTAAGGPGTDLFQLNPSGTGGRTIRLVGYRLGNTTEVGDAAEEGLELQLLHMTGTVTDGAGTGSTTVTPSSSPRPGGTAAGFTCRVNSPTIATTSGTTTVCEYLGWINRMSPLEIWYPDAKWATEAIATEAILLRHTGTLADDMVLQVTLFVEEEG
jgi:hypothetical protein